MKLHGTGFGALLQTAWLVSMSLVACPAEASMPDRYSASEIKEALQQTARDLNRTLPKMLDEEIRLDSAVAGNRELRYNYTLVNYLAAQVDRGVILKKTHKRLKDSFCKGETQRVFAENDIPVSYVYFGKDGREIARIKINPSQC